MGNCTRQGNQGPIRQDRPAREQGAAPEQGSYLWKLRASLKITWCPEEKWKILLEEFGPDRKTGGSYHAVHPANAFIGYYLRMELLSRCGEAARLLKEMKGYFLSMAQTTGTLWEHHDTRASCNHGFASHICVHLIRDVLGLASMDSLNRILKIKAPEDLSLDWCRGKIPVANGWIEMEWRRVCGTVCYTIRAPAEWRVDPAPCSG